MEKRDEELEQLREYASRAIEVSIEMVVQMLEDERLPKAVSTYCRTLMSELLKDQFTRKEAMQIICALRFPAVKDK